MGMRTANDPYGSSAVRVDSLIGTAYNTVKEVSEHLEEIKYLVDNMEAIVEIAQAEEQLNEIASSAPAAIAAAAAAVTAANQATALLNGVLTGLNASGATVIPTGQATPITLADLAESVSAESVTRAAADSSLHSTLSASISTVATALTTETAARTSADGAEVTRATGAETALALGMAGTVMQPFVKSTSLTNAASTFFTSAVASLVTGLLTFLPFGSGGVTRTVLSKLRDTVTVLDYGADPTGTIDSTAAFNAALLASKAVVIPPGSYVIAGIINMTVDGGSLLGAGPNAVTLIGTSTTADMLTCPLGLDILTVGGFTMTRFGTPTAGAGIAPKTINQMVIRDVRVQNQWMGMNLSTTAAGTVINCVAQFNYSHGFYMANSTTHNALQWTMINCLSQQNNGWGFAVQGVTNTAGVSIPFSPWIGCSTFANTGGGVILQGSSSAQLWDFSAQSCWFGSDNYNEMHFDTFGGQHFVRDCYMELAGTQSTGRTLAVAPSNTGSGVSITANNNDVSVMNCGMSSLSFDGIVCSDNLYTLVSGCVIVNVGLAGSGYGGVINNGTGHITVTGCRIGSTTIGATNQFGISVSDGALLTAVGNDLRANSLGAIGMNTNYSQANISGNQGYVSRFGGQITMPAGQTSLVVTHFLSLASGQLPTQVNVTALSNLATGVQVWADTFTATTFTLRVSASNGSNTFFSFSTCTSQFN